jgi:hypothetical protein
MRWLTPTRARAADLEAATASLTRLKPVTVKRPRQPASVKRMRTEPHDAQPMRPPGTPQVLASLSAPLSRSMERPQPPFPAMATPSRSEWAPAPLTVDLRFTAPPQVQPQLPPQAQAQAPFLLCAAAKAFKLRADVSAMESDNWVGATTEFQMRISVYVARAGKKPHQSALVSSGVCAPGQDVQFALPDHMQMPEPTDYTVFVFFGEPRAPRELEQIAPLACLALSCRTVAKQESLTQVLPAVRGAREASLTTALFCSSRLR